MTRTELLELIGNGENSGVEFKRDDIENRALAKELVALTNLMGGRVLLGIEDDGRISGITRPNLEEWVMTACRDKIRPEIIPFFEVLRDVRAGQGRCRSDCRAWLGHAQRLAQRPQNTEVTSALNGGIRCDRWTYPEQAIREAIVNAVVHRDYLLSSTTIEVSIYADRLEIISPGRLPNGITPARMRTGCRAARNQLLKDVMRDYNYLEHTGMGLPRKIIKGMLEHNGTEPDLLEEEERFLVRLWK